MSIASLPAHAAVAASDILPIEDPLATEKVTMQQIADFTKKDIEEGLRNAMAHNAIARGKNLGDHVTDEQYAVITAGTFDDLYIGDYWEINGTKYLIAAFDYWLHCGDIDCTDHHVVIVPEDCMYNATMNSSNTTAGGYYGSAMHTSGLNTAKGKIVTDFGNAHIMSHREYLTNAITSNYPSAGAWYDSTVELMNESMVYGSSKFEPRNSLGATIPAGHHIDKSQLPLFQHDHSQIVSHFEGNRAAWWLRDVVSASSFAFVNNRGFCANSSASTSLGVRPVFAIY